MRQLWRWVTRRPVLAVVVAVVGLRVGWWVSAHPRGRLVAWADQTLGRDRIKTYGYPAPWAWNYYGLLRDRYGVEVDAVAGCVVDDEITGYADGYNAVAVPRILRRHGRDVFAECAGEARAAVDWSRLEK